MQIAEKLKQARIKANLTQDDIAKLLGTTRQQISRYECGEQEMTLSRFRLFCIALDESSDSMLKLDE